MDVFLVVANPPFQIGFTEAVSLDPAGERIPLGSIGLTGLTSGIILFSSQDAGYEI
jgi:hypothetical protein